MEKRLYVGNLPFDTTEDDLHQLFSAHGQIVSAKLITDMETGRSRGFGFVEMSSEDEAKAAIEKMNKAKVGDRELTVNEARPRPGEIRRNAVDSAADAEDPAAATAAARRSDVSAVTAAEVAAVTAAATGINP